MRTKFTKASKKDGVVVTVALGQFDDDYEMVDVGYYATGQEIVLVINGTPTLFKVNRVTKTGIALTAITKCFPRNLRLPTVGRPVYAAVTEVC